MWPNQNLTEVQNYFFGSLALVLALKLLRLVSPINGKNIFYQLPYALGYFIPKISKIVKSAILSSLQYINFALKFPGFFCKLRKERRSIWSNQNLTEIQKIFLPPWHLFRQSNFEYRSTQSKVMTAPRI